jgi:hypothetical protein
MDPFVVLRRTVADEVTEVTTIWQLYSKCLSIS